VEGKREERETGEKEAPLPAEAPEQPEPAEKPEEGAEPAKPPQEGAEPAEKPEKKPEPAEPPKAEKPTPEEAGPLPLLGADFFAAAAGAEKPEEGPWVHVPPTYHLAPGDELQVTFWNRFLPAETYDLVVDAEGQVTLPLVGPLPVQGLTLAQFKDLARNQLLRFFANVTVEVTFTKLHSIQVFIVGGARRPGPCILHGLATVLDALMACGGNAENGSLRRIVLKREGQADVVLDLYRYLLEGDKSQDRRLEEGDTLFLPVIGPVVAVQGEVRRPARYELLGPETLRDVLEMAGGVRATGYAQTVKVERVIQNERRELVNLNVAQLLAGEEAAENLPLQDGDSVTIFSVLPPPKNAVTVEGQVRRPGQYAWTEGLTVADLLERAEGLKPEVYWERGEIRRPLAETFALIPFDVRRALARDPAENRLLSPDDVVHIYSPQDMEARQVRILGAVKQPGSFLRTAGMRVGDLLFLARGLRPDAYRARALLTRWHPDGRSEAIPIDLRPWEERPPEPNVELQDRDQLEVFSIYDFWSRRVFISGAVVKPGSYERSEGMRVSDLLFLAKGLRLDAHRVRAHLERITPGGQLQTLAIDLQAADPAPNEVLQDGDRLVVFSVNELETSRVSVSGAVREPGSYEHRAGMRVSDLLFLAGGLQLDAYLERANLERLDADGRLQTLPLSLRRGVPEPDEELRDHDRLVVFSVHDFQARYVSILGAVNEPGYYERRTGMRVSDLLFLAKGLRFEAYRDRANLERLAPDGGMELIPIDLRPTPEGEPIPNPELQDQDRLTVLSRAELEIRQVSIAGAVKRPGTYPRAENMRISDLLLEAQGWLADAYLERADLQRVRPDGQIETLAIDLRPAREGEPEPNLTLQDHDRLMVYSRLERTPSQVFAVGAVNQPRAYDYTAGMTVRDLLFAAQGLRPSAYLERAHLERVSPEGTIETIRIDLRRPDQPEPNPDLKPQDRLVVFDREEVLFPTRRVRVSGAVQHPDTYPRYEGMRVSDLLFEAGGLLPTADRTRAVLERERPDGEIEALILDLNRVLEKEPEADLVLADRDHLIVARRDETEFREREVSVAGAVARPGFYPRRENMTVRDLLAEAGGWLPEAATRQARLQRRTEEGRIQEVKINLRLAQDGHPQHNLLLADRDHLMVFARSEVQWIEPEVTILGAVQSPGTYERTEGMTVADLLEHAGGLLPQAHPERATIERYLPNGERTLLYVNLDEPPEDLLLQDRDTLTVYTRDEVRWQNRTVEIHGDVQRPGPYYRYENMRLSDLLHQAGGLIPPPEYVVAEVVRKEGAERTVLTPDLVRLIEGDPAQDLELQDEDQISIRALQEYKRKVPSVTLAGEVQVPGRYDLISTEETLRSLITDRARGLTPQAFPQGAMLLRKSEQILTSEMRSVVSEVLATFEQQAKLEGAALMLQKGVAPTELPKPLQSVAGSQAVLAAAGQLAESSEEERAVVTVAAAEKLAPYERVAIDFARLMETGEGDVALRDGDLITIPETPDEIWVGGAVARQQALAFEGNQPLEYYINQVGGYRQDADPRNTVIVHANGFVSPADQVKVIQRGDVILVPWKAIVIQEKKTWIDHLQRAVNIVTGAAAAWYVMDRLIGQ